MLRREGVQGGCSPGERPPRQSRSLVAASGPSRSSRTGAVGGGGEACKLTSPPPLTGSGCPDIVYVQSRGAEQTQSSHRTPDGNGGASRGTPTPPGRPGTAERTRIVAGHAPDVGWSGSGSTAESVGTVPFFEASDCSRRAPNPPHDSMSPIQAAPAESSSHEPDRLEWRSRGSTASVYQPCATVLWLPGGFRLSLTMAPAGSGRARTEYGFLGRRRVQTAPCSRKLEIVAASYPSSDRMSSV